VSKSYQVQYPDPIEVRTGDRLILGHADPEHPGWVWAVSTVSDKAGWVPEEYFATEDTGAMARRDYSAREVSVAEGDIVNVLEELAGWVVVETREGNNGWIPKSHLNLSAGPSGSIV
jgi:hypothetical protein